MEGVGGVGGGRLGQRDRRHPKGDIVGEGLCGDFVCGIRGGGGAGQASSSPVFVEPERGKSYSLKTETKILARPDYVQGIQGIP